MPGRVIHMRVGGLTGGVAAGLSARHASGIEQFVEVVGGVVGGGLGGLMPDWLEPATDPNHRRSAHSVATAALLGAWNVAELQAKCRGRAARCEEEVLKHAMTCEEGRRAGREALLWRLLAGLLIGFAVGYASHLLLDAGTRKGIPLI